jgi:hypothetical protein
MDPKDVPVVRFVRNNKGDFEEVRRRTSPMQPFRGGAPVPKGDE